MQHFPGKPSHAKVVVFAGIRQTTSSDIAVWNDKVRVKRNEQVRDSNDLLFSR